MTKASEKEATKTDNYPEPDTPMMRQYLEVKRRFPKDVLFFRMGDFYEMFLEDAVYAAKVLDIALTKRQDNVPMCGVPYHSMHNYVHPLLESRKNIAICEQTEDPRSVSGRIVERDVIRILTPGTLFEEELLASEESRIFAVVTGPYNADNEDENDVYQLALADFSTGELWLERVDREELHSRILARGAHEVLVPHKIDVNLPQEVAAARSSLLQPKAERAREILKEGFEIQNIDVMELAPSEEIAVALIFLYANEVAPRLRQVWQRPSRQNKRREMFLDDAALKTLEVLQDQNGKREGSLAGVVDRTQTAYGRRRLLQMLARPLYVAEDIKSRHDVVEFFYANRRLREDIQEALSQSHDLERTINALENAPQVRHLGNVARSLKTVQVIQKYLREVDRIPQLLRNHWLNSSYDPHELSHFLFDALYLEELPPLLDERRFIRPGYSSALDDAFELQDSAQSILKQFEQDEKEKWQLPTLKLRYNKIIGYYIEVSRAMAQKVPEHYQRRQTLVGSERFTSPELKDLESRILNAHEQILQLQRGLFEDFRERVLAQCEMLRQWADELALLDVLVGFAQVAVQGRYIRPEISEGAELELIESRHPVVEHLFREEPFVPNDVRLNNDDRHLAILTGPNMSGKSTFVRQIGLVQILAQAGCFVPASSASIPLADRVFTRIGAFDRLFRGESTFYVEMLECARIFQHFSSTSLILLDEVGRGTSTYDGIAIAQAMVEYFNDSRWGRPKTLFATHYAELADLVEEQNGIIGLTVQVLEEADRVVFLRKIIEGVQNKSYGIYVASLAGLPKPLIERANTLLETLEARSHQTAKEKRDVATGKRQSESNKATGGIYEHEQLSMFGSDY